MWRSLVVMLVLVAWVPHVSSASDGRIELNHACATGAGCLPGDTSGYPITIDLPGSYVLTGNLIGPDLDTDVVQVGASARGVSLHLNGFRISGPFLSFRTAGLGNGITVASLSEVRIHGGTIRGVGGFGILGGPETRVDRVTIQGVGRSAVAGNVGYVGRSFLLDSLELGIDFQGTNASTVVAQTVMRGNDAGSFDVQGVVVELGGNACDDGLCDPQGRKKFFLTQTLHAGDEAPEACGAGYHMASLVEIFSPSGFFYDRQRGVRSADSGAGPPSGLDFPERAAYGWMRTGYVANPGLGPDNCEAYTSSEGTGLLMALQSLWAVAPVPASPWIQITDEAETLCERRQLVWCVQD